MRESDLFGKLKTLRAAESGSIWPPIIGLFRSWSFAALLTPVLLGTAGCASNPEPHPSPVRIPPGFSGDTLPAADSTAKDSTGWWEEFQDPALDSLIRLTLGENFDLRGAWARFRRSLAVAEQAESARFPQLSATADASSARRFLNLGIPQAPSTVTVEQYGLSLAAEYEVDLWGRLADLDEAASLEAVASRRDAQALAMTLTARTAEAWYGLVTQRAQEDLLQEQASTDSIYLKLVRLRFGSGLTSAVDVYQQDQQLKGTLAEIPRVKARILTLRNQLAVLTGRAPGEDFSVPESPELTLPPLPETGLPLEVLDRRPDVQAAWLRLRAADYRVAAAVKDRLPALRVSGSIGYNAGELASLFQEWVYSIATSVAAPLIDGGRRRGAVEQKKAAVDAAVASLGTVLLTSLQEVEDALGQEGRQEEHIDGLRDQVRVSRRLLEETRLRYREGLTDYLPVLNALRAHHQLRRGLLAARHQRIVYRIQLYRALGGGWVGNLEPGRPEERDDGAAYRLSSKPGG
ncbi:MAG: TolC family protein [Longimicrobiales bacterium]